MNFLARLLTVPPSPLDDRRVFTLDHDGGLVVSIDEIVRSRVMDRQFRAVEALSERQRSSLTQPPLGKTSGA